MEDIDHYEIPVYNFPYDVEEDDEDTIQDNAELRVSVPVPRCMPFKRLIDLDRPFFPSLLSVLRKRLTSRESPPELGSTRGVSLKSTTPSTLTSAG